MQISKTKSPNTTHCLIWVEVISAVVAVVACGGNTNWVPLVSFENGDEIVSILLKREVAFVVMETHAKAVEEAVEAADMALIK